MKNKIVCVVGLGYVGLPLNFLASLKPLLKNAYASFLQAKTFTKLLTLFLLCKKKYFFGKAFFKPFRKAFTEIASLKERFVIKGSNVLIMGLTYKENVADTRESPVREMLKELKEFGVDVYGYDPLLSREVILERFSFSTGFLL